MKMIVYSHEREILNESWSSFLQQQQQAGADPAPDPTPPVDEPIETPFDKIDRSVMDDEQIAILDKSKEDYVKLVKDNRALATKVTKVESVASRYQSDADKARAELQRLQQPKPADEPSHIKQARVLLQKHGLKGEELEKQLPFFADMMVSAVGLAKEAIGHDLGPMAGTVLEQQATAAFTNARQSSQALQDPAIAQEVWDAFVIPEMKAGRPVDPNAINNYAKIVYYDKGTTSNPNNPPPPPVPQPRPTPSPGNFTFPGAQVLAPGNWNPSQNQNVQSQPDGETSAALTAVFSRLTTGTKAWPSGVNKPGRR